LEAEIAKKSERLAFISIYGALSALCFEINYRRSQSVTLGLRWWTLSERYNKIKLVIAAGPSRNND
jgi:hypothetical protein